VSCPKGWQITPDQAKCFRHLPNSLSWDGSEALCRNFSAHLATLSSAQDLNFAKSLCGGVSSSGCWVGGRRYNTSSDPGWKWSNGSSSWNETVFPGEPLRANCSGAQCGQATSGEMCALVTSKHAALVGKKCGESHGLICMINHGESSFGYTIGVVCFQGMSSCTNGLTPTALYQRIDATMITATRSIS
jgi:hypothetical protein